MPEAMQGYPKWRGELSSAPRIFTIAVQEARRGWQNQWVRAAIMFAFGFAVITIGGLYSVRNRPSVHTITALADFLLLLDWAALAIASIMAGPTLLEDSSKGALELYHSRGVSRWQYLAGKVLAVWGVAFVAVAGPGIIYYAGAYLIFETHQAGWAWSILGVLGNAALWSLVITGLGLGISSATRLSRAAAILLLGAVAILDILFGRILNVITKDPNLLLLSPLAVMEQQRVWLFAIAPKHGFPYWWGLLALFGLLIIGWGLTLWRHPRMRGVN